MTADRLLRWSLLFGGLFLIVALPFVIYAFPDAWRWQPYNVMYEHMIIAIYMVMGVFMVLAWRDPHGYGSFIWFSVSANFAHGTVMLVDALRHPAEHANLYGDIPAIFLASGFVGLLAWRAQVPLASRPRANRERRIAEG